MKNMLLKWYLSLKFLSLPSACGTSRASKNRNSVNKWYRFVNFRTRCYFGVQEVSWGSLYIYLCDVMYWTNFFNKLNSFKGFFLTNFFGEFFWRINFFDEFFFDEFFCDKFFFDEFLTIFDNFLMIFLPVIF